jgi:hypothetical protein
MSRSRSRPTWSGWPRAMVEEYSHECGRDVVNREVVAKQVIRLLTHRAVIRAAGMRRS